MLFNSYGFVFLFLPITVGMFFLLGNTSRTLALRWLILASLFFYAWWRPFNVVLIAPSILLNFAAARGLQFLLAREQRRTALALMILGVAFNVGFLGYFKYANFFVGAVNDVFGTRYFLEHIVLPLGISFITFQKIAFLVDIYSGRVNKFSFQDYCLFVLFFPQLIAGPIVHYREIMPQFERITCRYDPSDVTAGITLFALGLFKKAFLADGIAPMSTAIYNQAADHPITFFYAWMAAIGFTFQLYFDFSGYTDMALGLGRFFGVRLPPNFNSPLRAHSIIDFWGRWHLTLTRFLTAYIYNPLTLRLTRRRLAKGLPVFGGRHTSAGAFLTLLVFPTLFTMTLSGLWHGAGYLFILWGVMHGTFLVINHGWRLLARKLWPDKIRYNRVMAPIGFLLTLVCVISSMVFFRSTTMHMALNIMNGMMGMHGWSFPAAFHEHLAVLAKELHIAKGPTDDSFALMLKWIFGLGVVAFACPNSLQIMARVEPALGFTTPVGSMWSRFRLEWQPSLVWAIVIAAIIVVGVRHLGGMSEFLYWQF